MGSEMTQALLGGASPTDRAIGGVKRSLLADGAGRPLGVAVDWASRNDCKLGE